ncbi:unnamed protein product [Protopolystoma xenopodis]|uniref:Uncharacterized protein n=1 Tax=Protopolystoma xenopodis TaxID=117903 RepID=A0A3S5BUJ8_9PLAT|nr:unnamed protein product [Protopolystoma xenopodis]
MFISHSGSDGTLKASDTPSNLRSFYEGSLYLSAKLNAVEAEQKFADFMQKLSQTSDCNVTLLNRFEDRLTIQIKPDNTKLFFIILELLIRGKANNH